MKNISHKKSWHTGAVKVRAEPPPIMLIILKIYIKAEKGYIKIKFHRDTTL